MLFKQTSCNVMGALIIEIKWHLWLPAHPQLADFLRLFSQFSLFRWEEHWHSTQPIASFLPQLDSIYIQRMCSKRVRVIPFPLGKGNISWGKIHRSYWLPLFCHSKTVAQLAVFTTSWLLLWMSPKRRSTLLMISSLSLCSLLIHMHSSTTHWPFVLHLPLFELYYINSNSNKK